MNELSIEGRLLLEGALVERGTVLVSSGQISWAGAADEAPADRDALERYAGDELLVAPGWVDLHVHGAGGADFLDGTSEAVELICQRHGAHGTTSLCASVLSGPSAQMLHALERIAEHASKAPTGARLLGAHLEGPFLNPRRAGAQPVQYLRAPDAVLLEELLAAAGETLRIVTLAPELPGALELVARLVARGIIVALGHSDATWEQTRAAIGAGARLATHVFNAMRPLHQREPGIVGAVLQAEHIVVEAIADGIHLSGPVLELLWRLKGAEQLCLVTDCTAACEAPPGAARLGAQPVEVLDGAVRLADGTLAGSSLTMDRAVSNLVRLAGVPLAEALVAASRTPARLLGLETRGTLVPGACADLVLLDRELRVQAVFVEGRRLAG